MLQHRSFACMHSVMDMIFPGMTNQVADDLLIKMRSEALELENLLSASDPSAETYKLNEKARHHWMPVSDRLWEIVAECRHYHGLTNGYFDIGAGWHKKAFTGISKITETGLRLLETDERQRQVRFAAPEIALDFGAVGKGLLLRETDKLLTEYSVESCFISFGGSSILTRGHHPHGDHWPVAFRSWPDMKPLFKLKNDFASFSQGTPEGMDATAHIVNPYTNQPEGSLRISGVQADCPVIAEVVSTVLILASPVEAEALTSVFRLKKAFVAGMDKTNQIVKEFYYES